MLLAILSLEGKELLLPTLPCLAKPEPEPFPCTGKRCGKAMGNYEGGAH